MARTSSPKTVPDSEPFGDFVQGLPGDRRADVLQLAALMQQVTGEPPVVWTGGMVGFGRYAQRYADGRQAPWPLLGFSAKGREISVYLMGGVDRHPEQLARLGRCRTGRSCLYLRRVSDVPADALRDLLQAAADELEPHRIR